MTSDPGIREDGLVEGNLGLSSQDSGVHDVLVGEAFAVIFEGPCINTRQCSVSLQFTRSFGAIPMLLGATRTSEY